MVDIYLRVVWLVHLCHVTCGVIQSNVAIFTESQNDNTKSSVLVFKVNHIAHFGDIVLGN